MVDRVLVDEVVEFARRDGGLNHQMRDPWVRNACRRLKKGQFDEARFCAAIAKYFLPEATRRYGVDPGAVDRDTKAEIGRRLCAGIVEDATASARGPSLACQTFESRAAVEYVAGLRRGKT